MKAISVILLCLGWSLGFAQEVDSLKKKQIHTVEIEEWPQFVNGEKGMFQFIANNIKYQPLAIKNKVQGKIIVNFSVSETGEIFNISIKKLELRCKKRDATKCELAFKSMENECIRVIKAMPKWVPGRINGIPIVCNSIDCPFTFTID